MANVRASAVCSPAYGRVPLRCASLGISAQSVRDDCLHLTSRVSRAHPLRPQRVAKHLHPQHRPLAAPSGASTGGEDSSSPDGMAGFFTKVLSQNEYSMQFRLRRWFLFSGLVLGYSFYYLCRNSLNYVNPVMVADKSLGLGMTEVAAMTSIFPIAYGTAATHYLHPRCAHPSPPPPCTLCRRRPLHHASNCVCPAPLSKHPDSLPRPHPRRLATAAIPCSSQEHARDRCMQVHPSLSPACSGRAPLRASSSQSASCALHRSTFSSDSPPPSSGSASSGPSTAHCRHAIPHALLIAEPACTEH